MLQSHQQIAKNSLLLKSIPEALQEKILAKATPVEMKRGATIFLQGEVSKAIYIVLDGWVKLYRITPNGAEAVVGTFTKGNSFGEAVAFRKDTYPVSAETATDCTVLRVDAANMLATISEDPTVAIAILSATFAHLHSLVSQIEALQARTGAQRVAEFLVELCGEDQMGRQSVVLPYDKVLIAGRLGMKPESLSRAFGKLKTCGVRIKQNLADIEDMQALRDFIEEDPASSWHTA
ncbi:Crp/Fnr family transcriptional regulator [Shimia aestuarii]|uniref:Crp/Fnr family transcriptional regulator n=1 Tax=Shimia aestuarii TaxID=254406 RepID=UPI001FB32B5C